MKYHPPNSQAKNLELPLTCLLYTWIQFISKSCHMPSSPPTSPSPRTLILAAINLSFKILDRLYPPCGVCLVAQLCPTLCDPMDCSPPGSSVHGISQARILEWVAISFSRGSSQPRNRTSVSRIAGGFFTIWATREALCGVHTVIKSSYILRK